MVKKIRVVPQYKQVEKIPTLKKAVGIPLGSTDTITTGKTMMDKSAINVYEKTRRAPVVEMKFEPNQYKYVNPFDCHGICPPNPLFNFQNASGTSTIKTALNDMDSVVITAPFAREVTQVEHLSSLHTAISQQLYDGIHPLVQGAPLIQRGQPTSVS